MASLDVERLFTNIPLDETIANCINDLFSNNNTVHNFIKEILKEEVLQRGPSNLLPMNHFSHLIMKIIAN